MVGEAGFEPTTSASRMISDRMSTTCCEQPCTSARVTYLSERARIEADAGKTRESFRRSVRCWHRVELIALTRVSTSARSPGDELQCSERQIAAQHTPCVCLELPP